MSEQQMCGSIDTDKLEGVLRFLGLAAGAGKLVYGTPLVCEELRKGRRLDFVFVSSGASENTRKRIGDRCIYYKAELLVLDISAEELGRRLGRRGELAVVALKDGNMAKGIEKLINKVPTAVSETKER